MELTLAAFLGMFGEVCTRGSVIDRADYALSLNLQNGALPTSQREYQRLAEEAFESMVLKPKQVDHAGFQCFEDALRLLLMHDGRTFDANLRLAELAYKNPERAHAGVNALASLANYLRTARAEACPSCNSSSLLGTLERLMTNKTLFHNARECRNALIEFRARAQTDR